MSFILNEAIEEDNEFKLVFSDDSEDELEDEGQELDFVDDTIEEEPQDESFYRKVDKQPLTFLNQTKNLKRTLLKRFTKNILVKVISQKCLILKIEKRLNLIFLRKMNLDLLNLKSLFFNLKMSITRFFIRLFMVHFTID